MVKLCAVLPCNNHSQYVVGALQSILHQDYPRELLKVVVIDDGSDDGSLEKILSFVGKVQAFQSANGVEQYLGQAQDVPIMIVRHPQALGPSAARNAGIRIGLEEADAFTFLDADDYYAQGRLQKVVGTYLTDPDKIGLVYTDYERLHVKTQCRFREYKLPFDRFTLLNDCIVPGNSLISKKAFLLCGLYDESMRVAEDWELYVRLTEKFVVLHVPESLMTVRVTGANTTYKVKPEVWQACWKKVGEKARVSARILPQYR